MTDGEWQSSPDIGVVVLGADQNEETPSCGQPGSAARVKVMRKDAQADRVSTVAAHRLIPTAGQAELRQLLAEYLIDTRLVFIEVGQVNPNRVHLARSVAQACTNLDLLTLVLIERPSSSGGQLSSRYEAFALRQLQRESDALIELPVDVPDWQDAASCTSGETESNCGPACDHLVRSVGEILDYRSVIPVGWIHLRGLFNGGRRCRMSVAGGTGEKRVRQAFQAAVEKPISTQLPSEQLSLLMNVTISPEVDLSEIVDTFEDEGLVELIPDGDIIFGVVCDECLDDEARITSVLIGPRAADCT